MPVHSYNGNAQPSRLEGYNIGTPVPQVIRGGNPVNPVPGPISPAVPKPAVYPPQVAGLVPVFPCAPIGDCREGLYGGDVISDDRDFEMPVFASVTQTGDFFNDKNSWLFEFPAMNDALGGKYFKLLKQTANGSWSQAALLNNNTYGTPYNNNLGGWTPNYPQRPFYDCEGNKLPYCSDVNLQGYQVDWQKVLINLGPGKYKFQADGQLWGTISPPCQQYVPGYLYHTGDIFCYGGNTYQVISNYGANIPTWAAGSTYAQCDVVQHNGFAYVWTGVTPTSASTFTEAVGQWQLFGPDAVIGLACCDNQLFKAQSTGDVAYNPFAGVVDYEYYFCRHTSVYPCYGPPSGLPGPDPANTWKFLTFEVDNDPNGNGCCIWFREVGTTACVLGTPVPPQGSGWVLKTNNCAGSPSTSTWVRLPIQKGAFDPPGFPLNKNPLVFKGTCVAGVSHPPSGEFGTKISAPIGNRTVYDMKGVQQVCYNQPGLELAINPVPTSSTLVWNLNGLESSLTGQGTERITWHSAPWNNLIRPVTCTETTACGDIITHTFQPNGYAALDGAVQVLTPTGGGYNGSIGSTIRIEGPSYMCYDDTVTFSIDKAYTKGVKTPGWIVSNNLQILSGQGTDTIVVKKANIFATPGVMNIEVHTGLCSSGNGRYYMAQKNVTLGNPTALNITPPPAVMGPGYYAGPYTAFNPATKLIPTTLCPNSTGVKYSVVAPVITASYTWTVTGGTIVSGQGTNIITVDWGATPGDYKVLVHQSTGCACSFELAAPCQSGPTGLGCSANTIPYYYCVADDYTDPICPPYVFTHEPVLFQNDNTGGNYNNGDYDPVTGRFTASSNDTFYLTSITTISSTVAYNKPGSVTATGTFEIYNSGGTHLNSVQFAQSTAYTPSLPYVVTLSGTVPVVMSTGDYAVVKTDVNVQVPGGACGQILIKAGSTFQAGLVSADFLHCVGGIDMSTLVVLVGPTPPNPIVGFPPFCLTSPPFCLNVATCQGMNGTVKFEAQLCGGEIGDVTAQGVVHSLCCNSTVNFTTNNYGPILWKDWVRFFGFFGYQTVEFQRDSIKYATGIIRKVRDEAIKKFSMKTSQLPHWLLDRFAGYALQSDRLYVTDYNLNNSSYNYVHFWVVADSGFAPKYTGVSRFNKVLDLGFKEGQQTIYRDRCCSVNGATKLPYGFGPFR